MEGFGAFILGRNMFGPVRGEWPDESWKGWWGANLPYHGPTYVLTHHPRDPIEMEGGTTFIFVTNGIEAALEQAKHFAKGRDVKIGGGVETLRQYLCAGLIGELHLAFSPVATASPNIRRPSTPPTSFSPDRNSPFRSAGRHEGRN
jgi:dihydrofolate reductase